MKPGGWVVAVIGNNIVQGVAVETGRNVYAGIHDVKCGVSASFDDDAPGQEENAESLYYC